MVKISIVGGDISTGKLDLAGKENAKAKPGEGIKWKINNDNVVKSIVAIPLKTNTTDIFSGRNGKRPEKVDNKNWKADVADVARVGDVCEYSIVWKDASGMEHTDDPKISINASVGNLTLIIASILAVLFLSLIYWRMKRMKSKKT